MIKSRSLKGVRWLAYVLVFTTTSVCSLQTDSFAMLAPASAPAASAEFFPGRAVEIRTVQKALESKVLRQRLHELGLSDKEIDARLGRLSDAQVHQLSARLHALNAGGDFTIAGVLILVVLVLFILYLVKRV